MLVLFETPAGFALFKVLDEGKLDKVEDLWKDFSTSESARKVVKLKAFSKFENTLEALSAATLLIDGKPSRGLRKFLHAHCEGEALAVADSKLGNAIKEKLKIDCLHNNAVMELMRGLRSQLTELISGLAVQDLAPMSLGLSHSLSRHKLKFNPDKILSEETEAELKEAAVISMGTEVSDLDLANIRELCDQVLALSEYRAQLYDYLRSRMNTIAPNLTALVGELVGARLIAHGGSLLNLAKQPGSTVQILGAEKALFRALKTKHATPKYGLIFHASLIGHAAPKLKGKIARSLAAKTALAIRYDAFGDSQDNTLGLENRAKLEAHLRVLEGRELGRSAGSTRGKPKIEFYDKDRKKGPGALITEAKTYNPSTDLVLGQSTEPAAKSEGAQPRKRKHEEVEAAEEATLNEGDVDGGGKRKKKKKNKADAESTQLQTDHQTAAAGAEEEQDKKKKKKKKKSEAHGTAGLEDGDQAAAPEAEERSPAEKKRRRRESKLRQRRSLATK